MLASVNIVLESVYQVQASVYTVLHQFTQCSSVYIVSVSQVLASVYKVLASVYKVLASVYTVLHQFTQCSSVYTVLPS